MSVAGRVPNDWRSILAEAVRRTGVGDPPAAELSAALVLMVQEARHGGLNRTVPQPQHSEPKAQPEGL